MSKARKLLDDCFLHDKDRLRHDDAIALLAERLNCVASVEDVALEHALGRVLAADVISPRNIPAHTNAAVDGFAIGTGGHAVSGPLSLPVAMRIAAGHPATDELATGTAARIFTGAQMPSGADSVVMQEDCEEANSQVSIPAGVKPGMNVRHAGEDIAAGGIAAHKGNRLRPQNLAAIAATGTGRASCYRALKVALFSTGDEVIRPGAEFSEGQVYDANHFLVAGLLETVHADVTDFGILPDDEPVIRKTLLAAADSHDVILTTGGASRGEEDHIVSILTGEGRLHAWQLAVKPGRPLAFGQLGDTVFLGLPGNPVAAFICFLFYAQPMFAHLQGLNWRPPVRFLMPAGFAIGKKKPDRREFWRGWIENGKLQKFTRDGSGLISGLTAADGLIEISEEITSVQSGDVLPFIPFSEFGIRS